MFKIRKEQMLELGKVRSSNVRRAVIDSYRQQGFAVEEDPRTKDLLVTDKAGGKARIATQPDGVIAVTSGEGRTHYVRFDERGRLSAIADPAGTQTHFQHDSSNNMVAILRGPENIHRFEYDPNNKVTAIHFPDNTSSRFMYDSAGRLVAASDRNQRVVQYQYSETGKVASMIDWQGNVTSYGYSEAEVPTTVVLPNGTRRDWIQDQSSGRWKLLINGVEHVALGASPQQQDAYEVTCADGARARYVFQEDRIVEAVNPVCTVKFEYDGQGRVIKEDVDGRIVEYLRNKGGVLVGIITPDGGKLSFQRDTEQRVKEIQDWNGGRYKFDYAPSGAVSSIEYPNQVTATFSSNELGLPVAMRLDSPHSMQRLHTAHSIGEYTWTNDVRDRVVGMSCNGEQFAYQYDPEGRLIAENNFIYQLDSNGNRVAGSAGSGTFDGANQILYSGNQPFTHDARGNMISGACPTGPALFTYDGLDRLIAVKTAQTEARYAYDALGRRVRKQVGSKVTEYVWAGEQLLSETTTENGIPVRRDYLHFPDLKLPLAMRVAGKSRYLHTGRRAEPLCMTGPAGEVLWEARYSAFGQIRVVVAKETQPWRLAGQYYDEETGLSYVMARYYNPDLGRFLTPDPRGMEGGSLNFYTYCDGDPINKIDPTGELPILAVLAIGMAIGAVVGAGVEMYKQYKTKPNKPFDVGDILKEAGKGAVVGLVGTGVGILLAPVAGAFGAGLGAVMVGGAVVGGITSGIEQCVDNWLHDKPLTDELGKAIVVGVTIGAVTAGAGAIWANRARRAAEAAKKAKKLADAAEEAKKLADAERRVAQAERKAAEAAKKVTREEAGDLIKESEGRLGNFGEDGHPGKHVPVDGADPKALVTSKPKKPLNSVFRNERHAQQELRDIMNANKAKLDNLKPGERLVIEHFPADPVPGYQSVKGGPPKDVNFTKETAVFDRLPDGTLHLQTFFGEL